MRMLCPLLNSAALMKALVRKLSTPYELGLNTHARTHPTPKDCQFQNKHRRFDACLKDSGYIETFTVVLTNVYARQLLNDKKYLKVEEK